MCGTIPNGIDSSLVNKANTEVTYRCPADCLTYYGHEVEGLAAVSGTSSTSTVDCRSQCIAQAGCTAWMRDEVNGLCFMSQQTGAITFVKITAGAQRVRSGLRCAFELAQRNGVGICNSGEYKQLSDTSSVMPCIAQAKADAACVTMPAGFPASIAWSASDNSCICDITACTPTNSVSLYDRFGYPACEFDFQGWQSYSSQREVSATYIDSVLWFSIVLTVGFSLAS
ncbi:hypothetical protein CYMTET_48048 [Cymbomonas tetramitiformis]|uniref:Apple domain-containing protein n=1 Tax=Cymbomonas tetramitiformis TaxID=36881 RepID=A0AAE0BUW6_9CHLO|nr:hypothetical protein CYMTET_48048 [Cymbomonas tetramitiformis]